uniref:Uncharacterized protein n=1 Tax=Rhizophora mucronata TaxID=61149 RepID=A0A2P2P801_RHIMU
MEVMEARSAHAIAYLFFFGFVGGSKSATAFSGWFGVRSCSPLRLAISQTEI